MKLDTNIEPLDGEIFKDITEWHGYTIQPGYQVSNLGRVRHLPHTKVQKGRNGELVEHPYPGVMLHGGLDADGYCVVVLRDTHYRSINGRVHQLVAKHFLGDPPSSKHTQVNHIDGNKQNNKVGNLEWSTPYENNLHARKLRLNKPGCSQAAQCKFQEFEIEFFSKSEASKFLGYSGGYINDQERRGKPLIYRATGQQVHLEYIK